MGSIFKNRPKPVLVFGDIEQEYLDSHQESPHRVSEAGKRKHLKEKGAGARDKNRHHLMARGCAIRAFRHGERYVKGTG